MKCQTEAANLLHYKAESAESHFETEVLRLITAIGSAFQGVELHDIDGSVNPVFPDATTDLPTVMHDSGKQLSERFRSLKEYPTRSTYWIVFAALAALSFGLATLSVFAVLMIPILLGVPN